MSLLSTSTKYLIFTIGEEKFGCPLLSVKEVLEYQKPKAMPNMVAHFSGVVNVRGVVIGVIDLRKKLNFEIELGGRTAMLLCETSQGPLAAIVDSVDSVSEVSQDSFESRPPVQSRLENRYLLGVAKLKDGLATIIDLHEALSENVTVKVA